MALRGEKKSRSTKINIEKKHRAGVGDSWASTRTDAEDSASGHYLPVCTIRICEGEVKGVKRC